MGHTGEGLRITGSLRESQPVFGESFLQVSFGECLVTPCDGGPLLTEWSTSKGHHQRRQSP